MEKDKGAGILFYDESIRTVLAGFQPKHGKWSGFGGHSKDNESRIQTAFREVCEELFGISPNDESMNELIEIIHPTVLFDKVYYTLFCLPIMSIFKIVFILQKNNQTNSPYYLHMPLFLNELIEKRKIVEKAEVHSILLFHLSDLQDIKLTLTKEFYHDLLLFF